MTKRPVEKYDFKTCGEAVKAAAGSDAIFFEIASFFVFFGKISFFRVVGVKRRKNFRSKHMQLKYHIVTIEDLVRGHVCPAEMETQPDTSLIAKPYGPRKYPRPKTSVL